MSTQKTRPLGKEKYIKLEDIQNIIYDSDEESLNEVLSEEETQEKQARNSAEYCGSVRDALKIWYGSPTRSKSNISVSDLQGKDSIFNYLQLGTNTSSVIKDNEAQEAIVDKTGKQIWRENVKEWIFTEVDKEALTELRKSGREEDDLAFYSGRKRISRLDGAGVCFAKKFKSETDENMSDTPGHKPRIFESKPELENYRRSEPVKRRNINTIIEELELISRKLKEGYERYKLPVQWGTPIVKESSEKWDSCYLPDKLMERLGKSFKGSKTCNSSFLSRNPEPVSENFDTPNECKPVEGKSTRNCSERVDEEGFEAANYDGFETVSNNQIEDGLNVSNIDCQAKMTLRSKTRGRRGQDERIGNDGRGDSLVIERQSNGSLSKLNKDRKSSNLKKKLVVELERCQEPDGKYIEETLDSNKNFDKLKMEELGNVTLSANSVKSRLEEKANAGIRFIEEEQVVCPICCNPYEKNRIESHAIDCAREAFRD